MNSCVDCNDPDDDGTGSRRMRRGFPFFSELPGNSQAQISKRTREHCDRIFKIIEHRPPLDRSHLQHIQTLLDRSPRGENLLEPADEKGWNILQESVINNQTQVVRMIIEKGVDVNAGVCTLPLHLACKLGHSQIVEMLLDHGAKADLSRSVCYPVSHVPKPATGTSTTATGAAAVTPPASQNTAVTAKSKFRCIQNSSQALTHAIPNDRVDVVRVLLTHKNSRDFVKRDNILYEACNYRAKKSLRLLVEAMPEQVNVRDRKGLTPLQHALIGTKNRECAVILLESSAHFYPEIFEMPHETLLHQLYGSDDTAYLLRLTELILDNGAEDLVQLRAKQDHETLLHKLLRNFGGPTPRDREVYVSEVIQCIELLIERNGDPNAPNKHGETALHALLSHSNGRPLLYNRDRFCVGPKYMVLHLESTCRIMEVLFRNGANANIAELVKGATPLYYLMRIICAMSIHLLNVSMPQAERCLHLLCSNGADPNSISAPGDNAMTLLFGSLSRWLYNASDDPVFMTKLLAFTEHALRMFLVHGLHPQQFLKKNLKQYAIIFNSTNLDGTFLSSLIHMLKVVILLGGDPNLIELDDLHGGVPAPIRQVDNCPRSNTQPTQYRINYTVGYYLARGLYIHARYHNPATFEILYVFRNTLRHDVLAKLVGGICEHLEKVFETGSHNMRLQCKIKSIYLEPRTLKQMCRVQIFHALQWNIERGCRKLPLPQTLKRYLISI